MIDLQKSKTKLLERVFKMESNHYLRYEANQYYSMEDKFFKPLLKSSTHSLELTDKILEYKITPIKLKKVFTELLKQFNLENIKFSISNKKNGNSYYSSSKNTIFINKFYIDNANEYYVGNKNVVFTNESIFNNLKKDACLNLLHIVIHELAHAYTCLFFNEDSHHDSIFFNNHLSILKFVTKYDENHFFNVEQKIEDNYHIQKYYKITLNEYLKNQFILFKLPKEYLEIKEEKNYQNLSFKNTYNYMEKDTFGSFSQFIEYDNHVYGGLFKDYHIDIKVFKDYNLISLIDFKAIELEEDKQKDIFLNHVPEH